MKKYLVGSVGESGKLYFVPEGDRYDGLFISKSDVVPVPIFSFIQRRSDITPIMETRRQRQFWKLKFRDPDWAEKHFIQLRPKNENNNPYNKKAALMLDSLEQAGESVRAIKHKNR